MKQREFSKCGFWFGVMITSSIIVSCNLFAECHGNLLKQAFLIGLPIFITRWEVSEYISERKQLKTENKKLLEENKELKKIADYFMEESKKGKKNDDI